ncbi:hypothetical protein QDR03_21770, partial [Enterobacter hormaechei]|uniref:hypothetical protein n=1 Tax=Enterobacter hormaechei TaxID=158836 RepID=UPI00334AF063
VRCSFCRVVASPYPAYGCGVRFAGWWLRLTRPTGAVFVLPGGGFALPGLRVRCSFCRVVASPYPAYRCAVRRPGKRSATRQQRPQFCNTDDTSSWVYG